MSAETRIRFTHPYAGWAKGAELTVRLDVALSLVRLDVGEILDSPAPPPATASPEPGDISSEILPGLRAVRGIGEAKELALNAAGVYTLADLITADRSHLDASLDGTTPEQIDRWIAQAQEILT